MHHKTSPRPSRLALSLGALGLACAAPLQAQTAARPAPQQLDSVVVLSLIHI